MPFTGTRVLYIDDDAALVRLLQRQLGRRGFEVLHANDAEEGLRLIRAGGIHVVALDHHLPTGTGIDLLGELAAIEGAPAVVYVTGSAEMDIAVSALKAGASDFVPKTVGDDFPVLLESALEQAVDKTRLRAAKEAAEREVRAARDRAELLLREVNHRVANSLALVSSLVSLQSNVLTDGAAKDALAETQARIFAIAAVHKRLYTSDDISNVEVGEYLGALLENLQQTMHGQGMGATLVADLEQLPVATDRAISLGVLVTELVTNAFKYAYPTGTTGEIRVTLRSRVDGTAELIVADDGAGWSGQGQVKGTGLGARIIKAMTRSVDGEFGYVEGRGTTARLRFPLSKPA